MRERIEDWREGRKDDASVRDSEKKLGPRTHLILTTYVMCLTLKFFLEKRRF